MNATSHRLGGAPAVSVHTDAECVVRLYRPAAAIYATHVTGHLSLAGAAAISEMGDSIFARGTLVNMFHEWRGMASYESESRTHLTKWVLANHQLVGTMTFVVDSRLVAMGIATANLATRAVGINLRTVADRAAFDAALEQAIHAQGAA